MPLCVLAPLSSIDAGVSATMNNLAEFYVGYEWRNRWGASVRLPFPHIKHEFSVDQNGSDNPDSVAWKTAPSGDFEIGTDLGVNTSIEMYRMINYSNFDSEISLKLWSLKPSSFFLENTFSVSYLLSKSYGGLRFFGGPLIGLDLHEETLYHKNELNQYVPRRRTRTISLVKNISYGLRYCF